MNHIIHSVTRVRDPVSVSDALRRRQSPQPPGVKYRREIAPEQSIGDYVSPSRPTYAAAQDAFL